MGISIIPRWNVSQGNTKLQYFVDVPSFSSADEANYAAQALQQAADEWNSLALGISILEASSKSTANFDLRFYDHPSTITTRLYAVSFFPHLPAEEQHIYVTNFALSTQERGILKNVFLHELGHVLGLRHEFALDAPETPNGAVQLMQKNPISVMSYAPKPTMQQTDIDGVQAFYKLKANDKINGSLIMDFVPQLLPQI